MASESESLSEADSGPEDEPLSPEEQEEREHERSILDRNYEIMEELEHRTVYIKSNRYEEEDREYYVEEVEKAYIDGSTGYIPSARLINESVRPSLQPVLKMPRSLIPVEEDGEWKTLHLIYSHEPSVEHSFHYMNRYERPDLEIYISYKP
ncbi:MAG: hypothetical protein ABEJ65_03375 [bacterium]